ncbi:MAG: hypothetical protein IH590_04315 [Aquamicrobium sp.]|nr:hypothetical protein [Aquamicrobium sp.]
MADEKDFTVTEKAGAFVAGMRSPGAGKTLKLTEEQAFYPLQAGEIERPEGRKAAPARTAKTKADAPAGDSQGE